MKGMDHCNEKKVIVDENHIYASCGLKMKEKANLYCNIITIEACTNRAFNRKSYKYQSVNLNK